jgi:hypothetical protein
MITPKGKRVVEVTFKLPAKHVKIVFNCQVKKSSDIQSTNDEDKKTNTICLHLLFEIMLIHMYESRSVVL